MVNNESGFRGRYTENRTHKDEEGKENECYYAYRKGSCDKSGGRLGLRRIMVQTLKLGQQSDECSQNAKHFPGQGGRNSCICIGKGKVERLRNVLYREHTCLNGLRSRLFPHVGLVPLSEDIAEEATTK